MKRIGVRSLHAVSTSTFTFVAALGCSSELAPTEEGTASGVDSPMSTGGEVNAPNGGADSGGADSGGADSGGADSGGADSSGAEDPYRQCDRDLGLENNPECAVRTEKVGIVACAPESRTPPA